MALFDIFALETNLYKYKMEKPHAHKKQLLEMQKLYAEYNSAVANKLPDEDVEASRIAFYNVCDNYDWMDYVEEENGCEKLVNVKDEVLVPPKYEHLGCCVGKVNKPKFPVTAMLDGKWGLVLPDGKGTALCSFEYDEIQCFDKFFVVSKSGRKGVLDSKGRLLVPCDMDDVIFQPIYITRTDDGHSWYDDCMFELRCDGKSGVLTMDGQCVMPSYDEILFSEIVDTDEALGAIIDGRDGCVSIDGKLVPDEDFEKYEDKLVYSKGRYSHRSSYNYELDVKLGYAEGKI